MAQGALIDLEKKLEILSSPETRPTLFKDVEDAARDILEQLPNPDEQGTVEEKARILRLRSKARLLLPAVSKEAEEDLNTVLKLNKGSSETWVQLSECLLRRNASTEAIDALENALKLDPNNISALCQYSQVLRNRCATENILPAEKQALLEDAIAKAKKGIQIDPESGDAWNSLSLSLLSKSTLEGANHSGIRRAYSAIEKATEKSPRDPDMHFNKGMLESLLGHFGAATKEFLIAHELDKYGLKGARVSYEDNVGILRCVLNSMESAKGIGRREFKKISKEITSYVKKNGDANGLVSNFCVVNLVSEPLMQPVVLLTIDPKHKFCLLMLYQCKSGAFKIGDIISIPASSLLRDDFPQIVEPYAPFDQDTRLEINLPQFYGDASKLHVNGRAVADHLKSSLQVSARLFA